MKIGKPIDAVAGVAAIVVLAIFAVSWQGARLARTELVRMRAERTTLEHRIADLENNIRQAERLAAEAEQDRRDLLQALTSIRAQRATAAASSPPPLGSVPQA